MEGRGTLQASEEAAGGEGVLKKSTCKGTGANRLYRAGVPAVEYRGAVRVVRDESK